MRLCGEAETSQSTLRKEFAMRDARARDRRAKSSPADPGLRMFSLAPSHRARTERRGFDPSQPEI